MDITFTNRRLERTFISKQALQREYGPQLSRAIAARIVTLEEAPSLADVSNMPPTRRHQLRGDRDEQFAVDLTSRHRIVFTVNHDPVPRKGDGGIDLSLVTAIMILEVVDYH